MEPIYQIDMDKIHTKTVASVKGPVKQIPTRDGVRIRYDVKFTDGYLGEFCPLVGQNEELPKGGEEFTFRVKHRNFNGDEIERATPPQAGNADMRITEQGRRVVNMNGHPAITALNGAIRIAEMNQGQLIPGGLGKEILPSDVLTTAETLLDWLMRKNNS